MITLSIGEVRHVAHSLAHELLGRNEPIPAFDTRFPNILESCLATPFQSFNNKHLYPGLVKKASMLYYLMIKNHPFKNGNKRVAMTTTLVYLMKNGKWIKVDNFRFYKFTVWVAESDAKLQPAVVAAIETFIGMYLVNFGEKQKAA